MGVQDRALKLSLSVTRSTSDQFVIQLSFLTDERTKVTLFIFKFMLGMKWLN